MDATDLLESVGARDRIRAVGVDRIVAESRVAKMSLYRHFASKDDLVLHFLQEREQRWTNEWLRAEAERRGTTPAEASPTSGTSS